MIGDNIVTLDMDGPIWDRFFTVAPLVLVGSREPNGDYNLAPKHMAFPLGWENYFAFVCTPRHSTYQNIVRESFFTVSYPRPTQVMMTSLAASPRDDEDCKPDLMALTTFPATKIDGRFIDDGYLFLECLLDRVIDDFGQNSLIAGQIVAAHVHRDALRLASLDDGELIHGAPLLAYLEPGRFSRIEDSFAYPFPADFHR